jgi:16S rRNA (uracil1498-N3)-methyltransferase
MDNTEKSAIKTNFFFDRSLTNCPDLFYLNEEESFHAIKVLRHRKGDIIAVTDGFGGLVKAEILDIEEKSLPLKILDRHYTHPDGPLVYIAVCPVKKREKTELIVEKAAEIGANAVFFFTSHRSEREALNMVRLEKILVSAIKQSHNLYLPQLYPLVDFNKMLLNCTKFAGQKLIADCEAESSSKLSRVYKSKENVLILIGPEGGFTPDELLLAEREGFVKVSLGRNILRAETAAIYSLSVIKALNE